MSRKRSEEAIEAFRPRFVDGLPRQRHRRADGARDLRQARRLLRLRLPEVARGGVRAARLPVGVAAPPLPGRVPLRAAERAADGLLPAVVARPRRAAARDRGAPAARQPQRREVRRSRTGRCGSGSATSARSGRTRRRRSSPAQPYADVGDLARRAPVAARRARGDRRVGRLRRLGAAARAALAPRRDAARRERGRRRAPARAPARADRRDARAARRRPTGSGCSPTTATRRSRSASTRWSCCARTSPASSRARSSPTSRTARRSRSPGMAVARQRPATANGIVFMLLEDEHGQLNLIVPPPVYEAHRAIVRGEPLILARGRFERVGRNENVLVDARRDARPARAPRRERGRGARVAARARTTSATADSPCPTHRAAAFSRRR